MKIKHLVITIIVMLTAQGVVGQMTTSPYSKFGYGLLRDNATSAQRQMGGVGYAMRSGRQVNVMNPAAYSATDSLTFLFDMGLDFSAYNRKDDTGKENDFGGGLDYITMQFPVSKTVGVSAGVLPYSSVGYSFGSKIDNGNASHKGNGGMNQLYIGAGFRPFKGFSIGANVGYLFGNIFNDVYANQTNAATSSTLFEQVMEVKDYHLQFGAQYTYMLSRKNSLTLGLTFSPGKSLLGKTYVLKYDTSKDNVADTIAPGVVSLHNRFSLPDTWGAGIAYEWNNQLQVEADFTYQNWTKVKYDQLEEFSRSKFDNRWRVGVGASYLPEARLLSGSYFRRTIYRVGGFYNRDYITVGNNEKVFDYGVSCGVGLPSMGKTIINIGFEYHNRRSTDASLLNEHYFNVTLGVNFNDLWFRKSKLQ